MGESTQIRIFLVYLEEYSRKSRITKEQNTTKRMIESKTGKADLGYAQRTAGN